MGSRVRRVPTVLAQTNYLCLHRSLPIGHEADWHRGQEDSAKPNIAAAVARKRSQGKEKIFFWDMNL